MLDANSLAAIRLTIELSVLTTLILLVLGTPLAWWVARGRSRWRSPARALVSLPLVLPPSVLGFYLLVALGANGPLGQLTQALGWGTLAFTFWGLLIGSIIYSLPFVVQPLINAFESLGQRPLEAAATLRAGPLDAFWHVALPLARPGYLTVQIYDHVEALEYAQAHWLAGGMLLFSFTVLLALHLTQARQRSP